MEYLRWRTARTERSEACICMIVCNVYGVWLEWIYRVSLYAPLMSKGVVSECFKFWWAYSTVFWDEKSIGDIFKTVRPTGLPNFAQQCCQIFKFHYNYHTRPHRKLKICRIPFFLTRNRLVTFSKRSDIQGCQISHYRVARYSNFTIIYIQDQIEG